MSNPDFRVRGRVVVSNQRDSVRSYEAKQKRANGIVKRGSPFADSDRIKKERETFIAVGLGVATVGAVIAVVLWLTREDKDVAKLREAVAVAAKPQDEKKKKAK